MPSTVEFTSQLSNLEEFFLRAGALIVFLGAVATGLGTIYHLLCCLTSSRQNFQHAINATAFLAGCLLSIALWVVFQRTLRGKPQ